MARPVTKKTVQRVSECECGATHVDSQPEKISHADLAIQRAKRRLSRPGNTTWYLIKNNFNECFICKP